MKVFISALLILVSSVAFSKVEKIYYKTDDGKTVCLDPNKWEVVKKGSQKVVYKTKIVDRHVEKPIFVDRPFYVKEYVEVDRTKKNTVSLLAGFPFDYYNYDIDLKKIKYPLPGLLYTRMIDDSISISIGYVPNKGFGGIGYSF